MQLELELKLSLWQQLPGLRLALCGDDSGKLARFAGLAIAQYDATRLSPRRLPIIAMLLGDGGLRRDIDKYVGPWCAVCVRHCIRFAGAWRSCG